MFLANELRDQARLNTAISRERCRAICTEFLDLLFVERHVSPQQFLVAASTRRQTSITGLVDVMADRVDGLIVGADQSVESANQRTLNRC